MQQTLLAFLAMTLFMLLALNQQRASLRYHSTVYGRDVEMAALDLALRQMATIQSKSFDSSVIGQNSPLDSPQDLNSTLGQEFENDFDDVDDYNGFSARETHVFNNRPYELDIDATVEYVSDRDPNVVRTNATFAKQVTITVSEVDPPGTRPPVNVTLTRTLTAAQLFYH